MNACLTRETFVFQFFGKCFIRLWNSNYVDMHVDVEIQLFWHVDMEKHADHSTSKHPTEHHIATESLVNITIPSTDCHVWYPLLIVMWVNCDSSKFS